MPKYRPLDAHEINDPDREVVARVWRVFKQNISGYVPVLYSRTTVGSQLEQRCLPGSRSRVVVAIPG